MNFTIFYKKVLDTATLDTEIPYDIFISSFDDCERTAFLFNKINAKRKLWVVFPHYRLKEQSLPKENVYIDENFKEDEFFLNLFNASTFTKEQNICIDITGFIRPHLIFLIRYLAEIGINKIDLTYTEPQHYVHGDETGFAGFINDVRVVEGCSALDVNPNTDNDLLIINAGYDDNLIAKVSQEKGHCQNKYHIIGFPSLQPDMYQESILKIHNSKESTGSIINRFAPAFDPFVTAQTVHEIINKYPNAGNIYLSPLSTKPQTIGIVLYYIWNYKVKPINILFPFSNYYYPKTAVGSKRTWKYTFEFPSK